MDTSLKYQGVTIIVCPRYQKTNLATAKVDKKGVLKLKAPSNVGILFVAA